MKTLILALSTLAVTAAIPAQDQKATSQPAEASSTSWTTVAAWPVEGCIVSGRELEKDKAKTFEVDGRTFKTCCGRCQAKVEKDPEKYVAKLDEAVIEAQLASYPLETCPLSNRKLGGTSKNVVLDGTLVRVCCGRCEAKAPAKSKELAAKVVAAAHDAQAADYPSTVCPVSDHEIDEDATEVMYGTTLVRLCCDDCVADFRADPSASLAKLEKAEKARADKPATSKPSGAEKKGAEKKDVDKKGEDAGADAAGSCCSENAGAKSCCEEKEKKATESAAKGCCCEGKSEPSKSEPKV